MNQVSKSIPASVRVRKNDQTLVLKLDNVSAKIYCQKNRGYDLYTLTYYQGGKRVRRNFSALEEAKSEGNAVLTALANGQHRTLDLGNVDRDSYVRAMDLLAPVGVAIDTAAKEYASAITLLQGECGLLEAVRYYMAQKKDRIKPKLVKEVVDELVVTKKQDGKSEVYLKDLSLRLGKFADSFHVNIDSLSTGDLEQWLRTLEVSARTRNNYRNLIVTLFNFAKRRGYLAKLHPHAAEDTDEATEMGGEIGIFTPTDMQTLLDNASKDVLLFLAVGAFAGIRTAEINRLEWKDVDLERGYISVGKGKAKTRRRRLIPIQPNLCAWLTPFVQKEGKLIQFVRPEKSAFELAAKHKIEWKHNGLRHSFCSYRVAQTQNLAQTSLEAGNSPAIIESNYKELVRPDQAQEWFSIVPKPKAE